jgi:hypothetical protein
MRLFSKLPDPRLKRSPMEPIFIPIEEVSQVRITALDVAIQRELGRSYKYAHNAVDLIWHAQRAERLAKKHGLSLINRIGMSVQTMSGKDLLIGLWPPTVTVATLLRRTCGWYLMSIKTTKRYRDDWDWDRILITPAQCEIVNVYDKAHGMGWPVMSALKSGIPITRRVPYSNYHTP